MILVQLTAVSITSVTINVMIIFSVTFFGAWLFIMKIVFDAVIIIVLLPLVL